MAEQLKMKFYRVKLHTEGKSVETFDSRENEINRNFFNALDGVEIIARKTEKGDWCGKGFVLNGWEKKKSDAQMKEALYIAEQGADGSYTDDRERFDKDWEDGQYDMPAALVLSEDDVEILEDITEHGNPAEVEFR